MTPVPPPTRQPTTDTERRSASRISALATGLFATVVGAAAVMVACAPKRPVTTVSVRGSAPAVVQQEELHGRLDGKDRVARIALAGGVTQAAISATTRWRIDEQGGRQLLVRGSGRESWRVEQRGGLLRIAGGGGDATPWRDGPFVARAVDRSGYVQFDNRRYRGELWFTPTDSGILVVNRVPVEDYLRGVVPIELGTRQAIDRSALEAQAIAARSYTYMRVPQDESQGAARGWHMVATVINQVYAGVDVEHPIVNQAVDATTGLVIRYAGLIVDAPYSSSCGGRTAGPREAWRGVGDEPYLQPVDDVNPATGKPYCDLSPRNHWVQEIDEAGIHEVLRRALVASGASNPRPARVQALAVGARTPSGRIGDLIVRTDRGDVTIRASDLRNVFRDARGAILSSTYFSVERELRGRGQLSAVSLRGHGNGHGVGMCQWGAIGRSRAGIDARSILRHYYPGTVVGFAD